MSERFINNFDSNKNELLEKIDFLSYFKSIININEIIDNILFDEKKLFSSLDLSKIDNDSSSLNTLSNSINYFYENGIIDIFSIKTDKVKSFERDLLNLVNLLRTKGHEVYKIRFNNYDSLFVKRIINNTVGRNFPILEVYRLEEGYNVFDITFSGIKKLNDNISKKIVDLYTYYFKKYLISNFDNSLNSNKIKGRLIRSNYKHVTFSMDKSDIGFFFDKYDIYKVEFLSKIFDSIPNSEINNILKELGDSYNKDFLKYMILRNFDFGIGESSISYDGKGVLFAKLQAFYEAEIFSKNSYSDEKIHSEQYSDEKIKNYSSDIVEIEEYILKNFRYDKFSADGLYYNVCIQEGNKSIINPILLRYVRKEHEIKPKKLELKVKQYINNLNTGFDFLVPVFSKEGLIEAKKINEGIKNGELDISYFEKNYKNTYTKIGLEKCIKGKDGLRLFVDILDTGVMNICDFKKLAYKVYNGTISSYDLMKSGKSVTDKFRQIVKGIKVLYPESKISLGGDEIYLFISGLNQEDFEKTIKSILNIINYGGFSSRLSYSYDKYEKIYDDLDYYTKINKILEKNIEKVIFGKKIGEKVNFPKNILINLSDEIVKNLENVFLDIVEFINQLSESNDFINFVLGDLKKINIKLGNNNIYLEKKGLLLYFDLY